MNNQLDTTLFEALPHWVGVVPMIGDHSQGLHPWPRRATEARNSHLRERALRELVLRRLGHPEPVESHTEHVV